MNPEHMELQRQYWFVSLAEMLGLIPYFEVQSAGAIGANMEVGLSHNTDAATFEGGAGIDALRTLTGTAPNILGSAGNFTAGSIPKLVKIGTTGLVGLQMFTVADDIKHTMLIPSQWDRHHRIYVRVVWATESVTNLDSVTWKFLYNELTPNVTTLIEPATELDTAIAADAVATGDAAKLFRVSPAGIINAKAIADAARYWSFLVEADAQVGNPLTDGVYFAGVEFEYTPKLSWLPNHREAHAWVA